jgi:sarcosine oxidase subunit gamma
MTEFRRVDLGHINLRGNADDDQFVKGAAEVLGQGLPLQPNTVTRSEHRVYWLGPDEWQIVTPLDRAASRVAQLEKQLAGQHVAINDLSGGQVALHLSGGDVPALLAKGCTLDLHASVFRVGSCAQSGLAKANVLLGYIDAAPVYEIIVRLSFSEYLLHWLRQNTHSRAGSASY